MNSVGLCTCSCHIVSPVKDKTNCRCLCYMTTYYENMVYKNNNEELIKNLNLQIKELEIKIKSLEKWSNYAYKDITKRLNSLEKLNLCKGCNGEKFIPLNIGTDIYKIKCADCS